MTAPSTHLPPPTSHVQPPPSHLPPPTSLPSSVSSFLAPELLIWSRFLAARGWSIVPVAKRQRRRPAGRRRHYTFHGVRPAADDIGISHHTLLRALRGAVPSVRLIEAISGIPRAAWRRLNHQERMAKAKALPILGGSRA
jgi:hypothetical protein